MFKQKILFASAFALAAFSAHAAADLSGFAATAIVSPERPLSKDLAEQRRAVHDKCLELASMRPEDIRAHPSADFFPGAVPKDAKRVSKKIKISHRQISEELYPIAEKLSYSGWDRPTLYSTGLYAAPGELVKITMPQEMAGRISVQIGCHSDDLNRWMAKGEDWRRMPLVVNSRLLENAVNTAANAFGGLIYLSCPPTGGDFEAEVEIENAVPAPHFVLGKTTEAQWRKMLENSAAPWGEVECASIILTISADSLKKIPDIEKNARVWDAIVGACYDLAQIPVPFYRKQRVVSDVHIGGGFMHSGYPVMAQHCPSAGLESESYIYDPAKLMNSVEGAANWGFFHEIGHNMQNVVDWVFGGSTEVTVNLFTLSVFDTVLGGRNGAHPGISKEETRKMTEAYFASGAKFEDWQKNPFLGLIMFRQIQADFGWDMFKRAFKKFNEKGKPSAEKTDGEKIDGMVLCFSEAAGRDMMPFFRAWGVPVSDSVREKTKKYRPWMPCGFEKYASAKPETAKP